jgi:hypothetical protein
LKDAIAKKYIVPQTEYVRPESQFYYNSQNGNFRIHFDTIGVRKVPFVDLNKNKIPDFVDSLAHYLEFSYSFYKSLGYKEVINDSGRGGNNAIDVYLQDVKDFGSGYGYTDPEERVQDLPTRKFVSYIVMDNDYSVNDSIDDGNGNMRAAFYTNGFDAFKVTAAHELHHVIQYCYGIPIQEYPMFMEMASTYMESQVFPDINDYYQFLPKFFANIGDYIFSDGNAQLGYRYQIFFRFLSEKYSIDIIRKFWEYSANEEDYFAGLNRTLKDMNSDFNQEWLSFLEWMYFTGSRSIVNKYFVESAKLPQLPFAGSIFLSGVPYQFPEEALIAPYQIKTIRYVNRTGLENDVNVIDFVITNLDSSFKKNYMETPYILKINDNDNWESIGKTKLNYQFSDDKIQAKVYINNGQYISNTLTAIPNPVKLNENDEFYLKLTKFFSISDKLQVLILNSEGLKVAEFTGKPIVFNSNLCIKVNTSLYDFSTGNYIAIVYSESDEFIGKFSIIK